MPIGRKLGCSLTALGGGFSVALMPLAAISAPLDAEACQRLSAQRQGLETRGVRQLVATATQKPKAQFSADQIANIRLLMDLDGQLRFRCPMDGPIATLKEDTPDEPADGLAETGQPTGAQNPRLKPKQKAVAGTAKSTKASAAARPEASDPAEQNTYSATTSKANNAKQQRPPSPVKKASEGKVDDAFRAPPASDQNGKPLDKQIPADVRTR